jgi:phosphotransferase system enzyme I (PtsI)
LEEIPTLKEFGGQGIGLYRTEFLYLNRHDLPSEDEHLQMYRRVVEGVRPLPAIIRTVDLGGDKFVSKLTLAEEMNPAMGLRAIRFCLKVPEIFKVQLRALLRASAYGQVKIMFPMISGIEEIREAKQVVTEVKEDLDRAGITYDRDIQIGIMVEIPSAALMADLLAREVDFFSIGTNDLIQYFMAIDRVNEQVAYLYEPLHPAVIRIIVSVIEGAHRAGIPVAMCGEMAGDPVYALVLLGLGLDELSMAPHSIPVIKKVIRESSFAEGKEILGEILKLATAKEIEKYVRTKMALRFPAGFPKSFTSDPARGWC